MEATKIRLKSIAIILATLLLFQSCVVYHKTPTTLEKASQEQIKNKVTTTNGEVTKYKFISQEEGVFYGNVEEEWGEFRKVPLDSEEIITIRTKNKTASTLVTITVITIPVLALVAWGIAESVSVGEMQWAGL